MKKIVKYVYEKILLWYNWSTRNKKLIDER